MTTTQFVILLVSVLLMGVGAIVAVLLTRRKGEPIGDMLITYKNENERALERTGRDIKDDVDTRLRYMSETLKSAQEASSDRLAQGQEAFFDLMTEKQNSINNAIAANSTANEERFKTFESGNTAAMSEIRLTMERRITSMQQDNDKHIDDMRTMVEKSLDEVRATVDEKLQKTLNDRITESFKMVNDRLSEVYQGLGEMKNLAVGVGDLKKVLTNVKTRGTLGEVQLGAILEEILTPDQYVKNFDAKRRSQERVEFAVRLPGDSEAPVYLPIDSKFPSDAYVQLLDAYESADPERVASCQKHLCDVVTKFARDIRDKYIDPPRTTEFAVMFLPTEGIYAEVVRLGMIEKLQAECRVNIAGPSTMAALLNSMRMGFSILAMQKRSGEAWQVLGAVKAEFGNFENVLLSAQKRLNSANDDLEKLIGTRTRAILRKLKDVETLPSPELPPADDYAEAED